MVSSTFPHSLIICFSTQGQESFTSKQGEEVWAAGKGGGNKDERKMIENKTFAIRGRS